MLREASLKFTRDLTEKLLIRSVDGDAIRVYGETFTASFALTAEEVLGPWHATPVADLSVSQFAQVLATQPASRLSSRSTELWLCAFASS